MANLPGDHDTFMLYEPEVGHRADATPAWITPACGKRPANKRS